MWTQQIDIKQAQSQALVKMLQLDTPNDYTSTNNSDVYATTPTNWKILIYDDVGKNIISPNIKVPQLIENGVTLMTSLSSKRSTVKEVPAVYFIYPSQENVNKVCKDIESKLYESYYFNFVTHTPEQHIKQIAESAVKSGVAYQIAKIYDRYLNFVALSPFEFSLNLPNSYTILNGNGPDYQIEGHLEQIVDGLFSMLMTIGVIPIIRCPSESYSIAYQVAIRLQKRLNHQTNTAEKSLFSDFESYDRPVLILLDRDFDFSVMLSHTWTYGALMHDLLGMRLNQVSIDSDDSGNHETKKTYELDWNDKFWATNMDMPFPQAATAIGDWLAEYNTKMEKFDIQKRTNVQTQNVAHDFNTLLKALPEMDESKKRIDMHTSIAQIIVTKIKNRSLDKFFELENEFESGADRSVITHFENLLNSSNGTTEDKARALLCLYLAKPHLQTSQIQPILQSLKNAGWEDHALNYFFALKEMRNLGRNIGIDEPQNSTPTENTKSLGGFGYHFVNRGIDLLQGVKSLLPIKSNLPISKIVESLIEQKPKPNPETKNYNYIDTKANQFAPHITLKVRSNFQRAIVFVVGGGNFVEANAMRELSKNSQKNIIYGSTDFVTPQSFLEELSSLGKIWHKKS